MRKEQRGVIYFMLPVDDWRMMGRLGVDYAAEGTEPQLHYKTYKLQSKKSHAKILGALFLVSPS